MGGVGLEFRFRHYYRCIFID